MPWGNQSSITDIFCEGFGVITYCRCPVLISCNDEHLTKLKLQPVSQFFLHYSARSRVQSALRRVTCICCCSVSNIAGPSSWQQCWMREFEEPVHTDEAVILNQHYISPYSLSVFFLSSSLVCHHCLFLFFLPNSLSLSYITSSFAFFPSCLHLFPMEFHFLCVSACVFLWASDIILARRQYSGTFLFSVW